MSADIYIESVAGRVEWRYAYFGDYIDGTPLGPDLDGEDICVDESRHIVVSQDEGQGPFAVGPAREWAELAEISAFPWAYWAPLDEVLRAVREDALSEAADLVEPSQQDEWDAVARANGGSGDEGGHAEVKLRSEVAAEIRALVWGDP